MQNVSQPAQNVSQVDGLSIRPVLLLGFLAASAPTILLFTLRGGSGSVWYGPLAHSVLCGAVSILCVVIAGWLAEEARLTRHPALGVLSDGFFGLMLINVAAVAIENPVHLILVRTLSVGWTLTFGASASALLLWTYVRRRIRELLINHRVVFHSISVMIFSGMTGVALLLDHPVFHSSEYDRGIRTATFVTAGIIISAILAFTLRLYLRKRNTVILFFNLGLYLYTLSIFGQAASPAWSLPWWFSQGVTMISVFTIAYGILEANRVRDRFVLIETLAARSDELQKSHEDLANSEARYRSLVNNAPYGVFRLDDFETIEAVNRALSDLLGYESEQALIQGCSWPGLFQYSEEYQATMLELRTAGRVEEEVLWRRSNGSSVKVRLRCRRVSGDLPRRHSFEGIVEDLSAQSHLEDQLRQSQKMEAVGRLAGGLAHDFNNLLTIISGYTAILMDTLAENDPRRADAERVKHATGRAAGLTRQLLAFSRKQVLTPTTLDLNSVVADLARMLPRLVGEDIDFAFVPGSRLASIYADRGQVEQVLMNLIVNARDAMPGGGKITVETSNEKLDEKYARQRRGVFPGDYVMLAVTDTGCGMDSATQSRIFDPFFTTKEEGKGTGLGLAVAYGIVKQSGGHIAVYSEPKQGTTFKVYFPAKSTPARPEAQVSTINRRSSGETLLVIEDEDDLRSMIVRALGRLNYTVFESRTGEEALELVRARNLDLHLVITDIVMPGMRGTDAAQKLAEMIPGVKVLYMSGYTDNAMLHQKLLSAGTAFIQKPFTLEALEDKVGKVLDSITVLAGD